MALDTFSALKTTIASFLNRSDLTSIIPDFITLCEAEMNRRLRTRRMVGRADATVSATEFMSLPDDFGGAKVVKLTTVTPEFILEYLEPGMAAELQGTTYTAAGQPKFYSLVGDSMEFLPVPDTSYGIEMTYYKRIPALSDSNTSNWVLDDHPDAYLYGSLLQSAPYLMDDARITSWGTLFTQALADITRIDYDDAYPGGLNMRARSFG